MSIQRHQGPLKDSDGNPIGTTPNEPDDGTVRLDVAVGNLDVNQFDALLCVAEQILDELVKIRLHHDAAMETTYDSGE